MLPNPHLLISTFVRMEAVLSSKIEGTQASLTDVFMAEASSSATPRTGDVLAVTNYVSALEHGLVRLSELPLSLRLIREVHGRLMAGVRGDHLTPGEFRRSQNWIGPPGSTLDEAVFVPPPVPEMMGALGAFEKYLHAPSPLPALVRLALIHYQFEAIHPFLDGNGRVGRLLLILILCGEGLLPHPLLYLSAHFERHRDDYYRLLLDVSRRGAWSEWIDFFLRAVAEQSRDGVRRANRLLDLREEYRNRVQSMRSSTLPLKLVDELFQHPALTVARVAEVLGVSYVAARGNVKKLLEAGIVREVTGRQRNRVFAACGIIQALEAYEAP